jgi:hypothetical protein
MGYHELLRFTEKQKLKILTVSFTSTLIKSKKLFNKEKEAHLFGLLFIITDCQQSFYFQNTVDVYVGS